MQLSRILFHYTIAKSDGKIQTVRPLELFQMDGVHRRVLLTAGPFPLTGVQSLYRDRAYGPIEYRYPEEIWPGIRPELFLNEGDKVDEPDTPSNIR